MVPNQPRRKYVTRYSYSRLNTYVNCPFKYYLQYEQKHYIYMPNLAAEFGTLLHKIEERIAHAIMAEQPIDYDSLRYDFMNYNIPKTSPADTDGDIYGINILKNKYHDEFYEIDQRGNSYYMKAIEYYERGIYRLENFMKENPNLRLVDVERYFEINYNQYVMQGYIDRILQDKETGEYIICDIKTKDHPFSDKELTTPLQFVVYSMGIKDMFNLDYYPDKCYYDLPICNIRQKAGTKGFIKRGIKKLDKIFNGINVEKDFSATPSPLCYWCPFSYTNPNQQPEGKRLCPYFSLWTQTNNAKGYECMNKWEGMERHSIVLKKFLEEQGGYENEEKEKRKDTSFSDFPFPF